MLEFGLGSFLVVRVFIGMPFHGELAVGFLQVVVFGIAFYLEDLVVIHAHGFWVVSVFSLRVSGCV